MRLRRSPAIGTLCAALLGIGFCAVPATTASRQVARVFPTVASAVTPRPTVAASLPGLRARRNGTDRRLRGYTLESTILAAAARYDLDPAIIAAIIQAESGFNPAAISPKGAIGLMQLMPATATRMGSAQPLDPVQNIFAGSRYFRQMLNRFGGDYVLALAAYNAGPGAVEQHRGVPPYRETRQYIPKVIRYYQRYTRG